MKKCALLSLLVLLCLHVKLAAQNEIQWPEAVEVSTSGNSSAVVDVLEDGTPVVIWGQGSNIFFSKMENGAFTDPVQVSTGNQSPNIYSFGGLDMAAQGNTIYMVFEQFTNGVFLIRSLDGGNSFDEPVNVYDPVPGKWATLPSVTINDNGDPLVSVILENTNETDGEYIVMHSTDQGQSFSEPVVANGPADGDYVCECCTSTIYAEEEKVWLIFRNNNNNLRDMWVAKSINNGQSFEEAVDVDDTDWVLNACPISGPKLAPMAGDSLISAWVTGALGGSRLFISTLDGNTMEKGFERGIPQTNTDATQQNPAIAGSQDTLALVWQENGFGPNGVDILCAFSTTGSAGLLSGSTNITEAPGAQSRPSLAYQDGAFHLIYASSGGLLYYKRGEISPASNTTPINEKAASFQLIHQPVIQQTIQLKYTGDDRTVDFDAFLYDAAGKLVQDWHNIQMFAQETKAFTLSNVVPGTYILSVVGGKGPWARQVLLVE